MIRYAALRVSSEYPPYLSDLYLRKEEAAMAVAADRNSNVWVVAFDIPNPNPTPVITITPHQNGN